MATLRSPTILCLTGPESTGKTTLAAQLASTLGGELVLEVARDYLQDRELPERYVEADLEQIAGAQIQAEHTGLLQLLPTRLQHPRPWLICDTDIQVIETWWWFKFGPATPARVPATEQYPGWLQQALAKRSPRHYLLLAPDLPWVADPLREDEGNRAILYEHYLALMARDNLAFTQISGHGDERLASALRTTSQLGEQ